MNFKFSFHHDDDYMSNQKCTGFVLMDTEYPISYSSSQELKIFCILLNSNVHVQTTISCIIVSKNTPKKETQDIFIDNK